MTTRPAGFGPTMGCLVCICAVLWLGASPARAGWVDDVWRQIGQFAGTHASPETNPLALAARYAKRLPRAPKRAVLAGDVSPEGHWTFLNRDGQRYTAANKPEMNRVAAALSLRPGEAVHGFDLVVVSKLLFEHRAAFEILPERTRVHVVAGHKVLRLRGDVRDPNAAISARLRPNLHLQLVTQPGLTETVWQLARLLRQSRLRVLSLDPSGPHAIAPVARLDPSTKRIAADRINPFQLARSLTSVHGQTVVLAARIEDGAMVFRGASGGERTVPLSDITSAAARADVNLVILNASAPRQAGDRNWFWQKVTIDGLAEALDRATLADFLSAIAGDDEVLIGAPQTGDRRMVLHARTLPSVLGVRVSGQIRSIMAEVVSEVAGTVLPHGILLDMVSAERQRELNWRLVPMVPSSVQFLYLGLMLAGLVALPVAARWWGVLWPAEQPAEYARPLGYRAAVVTRWGIFGVVVLPLIALPALFWMILHALGRWGRRLAGRGSRVTSLPAADSDTQTTTRR